MASISIVLLVACTPDGPSIEGPPTEAVQTGALQLAIEGLPTEAPADVTITGPEDFSETATESTVLSDLAPGDYEFMAGEVSVADDTYVPDPASGTVTVEADRTVTMQVVYAVTPAPPSTGALELLITGLPQDATPIVTVTGPGGFLVSVTEPTLLSELRPGDYLIAAAGVESGPHTYDAAHSSLQVEIEAGGTETVRIDYVPVTGAISFLITGLPSGTDADVTITPETGQVGGSVLVGESTTLSNLLPGTYEIASASTSFDDFQYDPDPHPETVDVVPGETVRVFISYGPVDGKIFTEAHGLGAHERVEVARIVGPGMDGSVALETGAYLTGLQPGRYEFTEAALQAVIDDFSYDVELPPEAIDVSAGETSVLPVTFTPLDGKLRIEVSGLAPDLHANITVTGPGSYVNDDIPATATLVGLSAGTYTITAGEVADEGPDWEPDPVEQTATVVVGETRSASVSYFKPPVVCCF